MTQEQKKQISRLRNLGLGYGAIGTTLNISRDAVKCYCRRNGLKGVLFFNEDITKRIKNGEACKFCGGDLPTHKTGRPFIFCSTECRRNYWKIHREEGYRSPSATYTILCKYCKTTFESYGNKRRKYCCHQHYILDRYGDVRTMI